MRTKTNPIRNQLRTGQYFWSFWAPVPLKKEVDDLVRRIDTDGSKFIREAIREKIVRERAKIQSGERVVLTQFAESK